MSSSKKKWLWLLLPLLIVVAAFGGGLLWWGEYPTEQSAERNFVIEEDFTKVRKIMVRTDAAKEIITMGGGSEFVEQSWEGGSANLGGEDLGKVLLQSVLSSNPDWEIKLNGKLKVRTLDEYVGQNVVTLKQDVQITPDFIESNTDLLEGSERLLDYKMTTRLEREDDHTLITLRLTQEIKTNAPWFAHDIADQRVLASVEKTLENQEAAMRKHIEENSDKAGFFPLN